VTDQAVPAVATPCTQAELYAALRQAWLQCAFDAIPTRASLLVLLAHWALETGWGHSCWNFNLGNKKRIPGRDYYYMRCNEVIGGHVVWFDPPSPACAFAAFPDLETGCVDYLSGLRGTFRAAWPSVLAGDPAGFCHALKVARYYTADEALYTAGVVRCYNQLDSSIPTDPSEAPTEPEIPMPHSDPAGTRDAS
jgi:flagellum-specific peptidoglycan hydrolase FlgJ